MLQLQECVSRLGTNLAEKSGIRIAHPQRLDHISPLRERLDVKSEMATGFPYRVNHASALAQLLAELMVPPLRKKGLIIDLDDTVWRGILGEVGVEGVSWDLVNHSHMHALFQQLVHSLSETGVLVAVASKNDPMLVDEVFRRDDIILKKDSLFPLEVNWGPKSESVRRILGAWNVGAESVVFVDDSPMELAEVESVHPEMECILFPLEDDQSSYTLLVRMRDLFGKESISEEDSVRLVSIKQANAQKQSLEEPRVSADSFLEQAEAEVVLNFSKQPLDPRALELVNKTN